MQTLAVLSFVALQLMFPPAKKEPAPPAKKDAPAAPAAAAPTPAAPEPAAVLQFKWPEGLDARVETVRSREQQTGDTTKPARSIKGTYRMRVRGHADGIVVRNEEFSGLQANDVILNGMGMEDLVASLVPSTVVTREGEFVRAEDTAAVTRLLKEMFEPFLSGKEELPPQFKEVFQQLASEDYLNATAAAEWYSLVAAWLDFPVSDEVLEEDVEEPSPVLPDVMIPMKVTQRMVEKGECTRGGVRYECGVFEMRSDVDPAALEGIMKRLLEGMKELAEAFKLDRFEMVTIVRVKLETGTMLPHELHTTRTVNVSMSAPGVPSMSTRQVERRASTFSY